MSEGRPVIPLGMLPDGHESLSRDASVLTETAVCRPEPHGSSNEGYATVSQTPPPLSRNGSGTGFAPAHGERETSPRADAVMTREPGPTDIRTTCTRSTAFVSTAGAALSSQLEVSSAFPRRHRRAARRLRAARTHRSFRYPLAAAAAAASSARLAAAVRRHGLVLSASPAPCAHDGRSSRAAQGTYLGRCDSAGARRDARAAAARAVVDPFVVPVGGAVCASRRVAGLAHLEPALRERHAVHAAELDGRRRVGVDVAVGVAGGAAVPRVSVVADSGLGRLAEHLEGVRVALTVTG